MVSQLVVIRLLLQYDCNDNDPAVASTDVDGDGFLACLDDCNDNDALFTPEDNDGDGLSTCEGDCDDTDAALNQDDVDGDGFLPVTMIVMIMMQF